MHITKTEWLRRVALSACQVTPAVPVRASGNHLSSQNDEPEPTSAEDVHLAEEAAIAADLARNVRKAERAHERNDAHAMDLQIQLQGYIGGLS